MTEQAPPIKEPVLPFQIPVSHLRVIFSALGKLPLEVAGPTDTLLKAQVAQLQAIAKQQTDERQAQHNLAKAVGDLPPGDPPAEVKKTAKRTANKKAKE